MSRSLGLTIEQRQQHEAATSAFEKGWYSNAITDESRATVLVQMLFMIESGHKAKLTTAAQQVGVPGPTARSWKLRSRSFAEAVDAITSLPPVLPPAPEPGPEPLPPHDFQQERVQLVEEIEHWTWSLRNEGIRARNGRSSDVPQCERELHRRRDRLAILDEYLERR